MPLIDLFSQEDPGFAALFVLALLQGLTEFLPVSSSGHLVLAQSAMGLTEPALVMDIALHVGTLLAVFVAYRRDLSSLASEAMRGRFQDLGPLVVGTVPAAFVGLTFGGLLEEAFHQARFAAIGLCLTAAILLVGEWARRSSDPLEQRSTIGYGDAICIGLAQAFAIWPGVSRSGSTIAMGLVRGLDTRVAARFSFLLSIPAILGAAVVQLPKVEAGEAGLGWGPLVWGILFAGLVGWGALRMLLAFLGRGAFAWFAVYCLILGGGTLLLA